MHAEVHWDLWSRVLQCTFRSVVCSWFSKCIGVKAVFMIIFIARMHSDDIPEQRSAKHIIVIMKVQSKLLLSFTESSLDPWIDPEMDHGKLCSETWSSWIHLQNSNVKLMLNDPRSITKREGNFLNEEKRKKLGIDVKQVPPIGGPHLFLICPRERSIQQDPLLHIHSWLLQLFCSSFCKVEISICFQLYSF